MTETTATPKLGWIVLYVDDVVRSTELYCAAFGLETSLVHPAGDYTEFATGATALSLCSLELASQSANLELSNRAAPTSNITFTVDDVDSAYAKACKHGATPQVPPVDKPWGQRTAMVTDFDNNLIELASRVAG